MSTKCGRGRLVCFIDTLDSKFLTQINQYSRKRKSKFGGGRVLKSLFYVDISISLASENVSIKFDVADSEKEKYDRVEFNYQYWI